MVFCRTRNPSWSFKKGKKNHNRKQIHLRNYAFNLTRYQSPVSSTVKDMLKCFPELSWSYFLERQSNLSISTPTKDKVTMYMRRVWIEKLRDILKRNSVLQLEHAAEISTEC